MRFIKQGQKLYKTLACLALFISPFIVSAKISAAPQDTPPFYKITMGKNTAYLLGSVHVGQEDFYPLNTQIEQAFVQSDVVVIEADDSKADTMALIRQYALTTPEIQQQTIGILKGYCTSHVQVCQQLASFAPWMQAAQITMLRYAELGLSAEQGVDLHFKSRAQDKPVLELESMQFQFDLISSFSLETQLQMLDEAVNASNEEMLALISAWRSGDESQLANIMQAQAGEADELLSKLLWQRNHTMSAKMQELMQRTPNKQLFFIIGAGHLVGEQNIPDLLKANGLDIKPCKLDKCEL